MEYRSNNGYVVDKNSIPKISFSKVPELGMLIAESKAKLEQTQKTKPLARPEKELNYGSISSQPKRNSQYMKNFLI